MCRRLKSDVRAFTRMGERLHDTAHKRRYKLPYYAPTKQTKQVFWVFNIQGYCYLFIHLISSDTQESRPDLIDPLFAPYSHFPFNRVRIKKAYDNKISLLWKNFGAC